jgi:hypothetical protein
MNVVLRSQIVSLLVCLALSVFVSSGCSSGSTVSGTYPVTGKVTYKGQPVAGATITFVGQGADARSATALSGPDGSYSVRTVESEGAMPGTYKVLVDKTEGNVDTREISMEEAAKIANQPLPKMTKPLPAKYNDAAQTPLSVTVKEEPNTFDIELKD